MTVRGKARGRKRHKQAGFDFRFLFAYREIVRRTGGIVKREQSMPAVLVFLCSFPRSAQERDSASPTWTNRTVESFRPLGARFGTKRSRQTIEIMISYNIWNHSKKEPTPGLLESPNNLQSSYLINGKGFALDILASVGIQG